MHTLDLGVYQYAIPSAIWDLTCKPCHGRTVFVASTKAARLLLAYASYKKWCEQHKVAAPVTKFVESSFKKQSSKYVMWSQITAKAAQMKHLLFWLADICNQNVYDEYSSVRAAFFNSCLVFETVCRSTGRFLSPEEAEQVCVAVETALQCYTYLRQNCPDARLFHSVPKFHMWTHMAYDFALRANPRRVHAYADEDMIGKIKKILEHCHGSTATSRGLLRYLIWVSLRWWVLLHGMRNIPLQ